MVRACKRSLRALVFALPLILSAPAWGGPPFMTDDPEPVDYGHWEIDAFSAGAYRAADVSGVGPALEVNYGVAENVQLHSIFNSAFDHPAGQASQFGVGDTELGVKYRFITPGADDWYPEVAVFPLLEVPSGNARDGLGSGHLQEFLPVWVQKNFDKWSVYGGGGYWITPGAGNRNYWFSGILVQRQITDHFALATEVFHQTSSMSGRDGSSGFTVGSITDISDHVHILISAGRGGFSYVLDTSAVHDPFTYYAGLQFTF